MLSKVIAWLRQETTGYGFSLVVMSVGGGLLHEATWPVAAIGMIGGAILMAWPQMAKGDADAVAKPTEQLASDLLKQFMLKRFDAVTDVHDAVNLFNAIEETMAKYESAKAVAPQTGVVTLEQKVGT